MAQLAIHLGGGAINAACSLCGDPRDDCGGLQLLLAETAEAVCHDCGRRHAPGLAALLELALAADRAGRIGRHSVFPPYKTLLELARAAENYTNARPQRCQKVA